MNDEYHMADLTTLLEDDQPVMTADTPSVLVERLIDARDGMRGLVTDRVFRERVRDVMADAANHITAERKAVNDLANLAEDERQRANRLMELLTQAREYVSDALDAYRHDDGLELLRKIDAEARGSAALNESRPDG